jgi:alkylation response protein AidB-like acyl-CoA dehydrogenase
MIEQFERLLQAQAGSSLLPALHDAGYLDALRDLSLTEAEPLVRALGRNGIAEPVADTMAARAVAEPSRALLAVLAAVEMAGIGERLLEMSLEHANQRSQFGKPIGRFQAVQQQLAVLAEQVVLVRIAAQAACRHGLDLPDTAAGVAKSVASAAAPVMAGIAHAVHGAIGIAAEFPLHRYTARLHALRMAHGAESFWNSQLGAARLRGDGGNSLDFVRAF